ncbi:MAG: 4'-phosphopantetheinyl transferase superfamily protein [Hyphomicrobium sp.]
MRQAFFAAKKGQWSEAYRHFRSYARDCTPEIAGATIRVLYAPWSREPEVSKLCASLLPDVEQRQSELFLTDSDRQRFQQRRSFQRYCVYDALGCADMLHDLDLGWTAKGRPYLAGRPEYSFSFSACRLGFVGAWSSTHDIGIDIEDSADDVEELEMCRYYFEARETTAILSLTGAERRSAFFRLWTSKEAALKSIGEGIPYGLSTFVLDLKPSPRIICAPAAFGDLCRIQVHPVDRTDGCTSLVLRVRS